VNPKRGGAPLRVSSLGMMRDEVEGVDRLGNHQKGRTRVLGGPRAKIASGWVLGELWSTHIEEGRTKGGREGSRGERSGLRGELRV
jgi:hypothetical protein